MRDPLQVFPSNFDAIGVGSDLTNLLKIRIKTSCNFCNDMVIYLCLDSLADTTKKKPHMLRSDDRELR